MSIGVTGIGNGAPPSSDAHASTERDRRLLEACRQLDGVFVAHLVRALRETLPDGGTANAPGADIYASMLDDQLAQLVAETGRTGIADALYRQLRGTLTDLPSERT
jgi:flagellar protein FlgJ